MQKVSDDYDVLVTRAAFLAVIVSLVLISIKFIAWILTDSVSIFASFADSTLDVSASLINVLVIRFSLQPPDKKHNFGHGKLESLIALVQAVIISTSAVFVLYEAVQRLYLHGQPQATNVGIAVMLVSLLLTSALIYYQHKVIQKTQSQAIRADAMHYRGDLFGNFAVLVALAATHFGVQWADPLVALIIVGILLFSAKSIATEAFDTLMDKSLPEHELNYIKQQVKLHPQVLGMHELRVRKAGKTRFIQFHVELPDDMALYAAHNISDEIESKLKNHFSNADILIHLDPYSIAGKEHNPSKLS